MLQKIKVICSYDQEVKASYHWGSLFHGVLMKALPTKTAESLHNVDEARPFSQYVYTLPANRLEWHIGSWDVGVAEEIIKAVNSLEQIYLEQKNLTLKVEGVEFNKESEETYLNRFFTVEEPSRRYELQFVTPSTHKSAGEYVIFPTPFLILQNILLRIQPFLTKYSLDDSEAWEQVVNNLRIVRYNLRSASYSVGGAWIKGYLGSVQLSIRGPEQLVRLAGMLLGFAEYTGIGIKTSLGMGGTRIRVRTKKTD